MAAGKERLVDVPMAGTARESVKNARIDSSVTDGVTGDERNFGVNQSRNISEAERFDRGGYSTKGLNISTGRSKSTRFTGAK